MTLFSGVPFIFKFADFPRRIVPRVDSGNISTPSSIVRVTPSLTLRLLTKYGLFSFVKVISFVKVPLILLMLSPLTSNGSIATEYGARIFISALGSL